MGAIFAQSERGVQHALEMRVAHAERMHMLDGVADVIDAWTALADALHDYARASVQIELAHVRWMLRVSEEGERADAPAAGDLHRHEARLVDAARHLAVPKAGERGGHARRVDAERHAPAPAAPAQPHHPAPAPPCAPITR